MEAPTDLQNLGSFLGLTGYFRSLVEGYASTAQPLTDLARKLESLKLKGKAADTRVMKGYSLAGIWRRGRGRAAVTSELVLKGPTYDGTPSIITTDGCKLGFAGMCTQRFTTALPNGTEKERLHPIVKKNVYSRGKVQTFHPQIRYTKTHNDKFGDVIWAIQSKSEREG